MKTESVAASPADESSGKTPGSKNGKKTTPSSAAKGASSGGAANKTYTDMIHDAIVALKDRTGSSVPALKKQILTEYPHLEGPHFKNRFNNGLKSGVRTERFEKGKCGLNCVNGIRRPWELGSENPYL